MVSCEPRPALQGSSYAIVLALAFSLGCDHPTAALLADQSSGLESETPDELRGAIDLYVNARLELLTVATDEQERAETIVPSSLVAELVGRGEFEALFLLADESFEAERDRALGAGSGPGGPRLHPARPARMQVGELGGLDSSSCRSCHFNGGPDGSGTGSQSALFRGDGETLSSATIRDAPHVMGLGYLSLVARGLEAQIQDAAGLAVADAVEFDAPQRRRLEVQGVYFGHVTGLPDGSLDTSELTYISPDLVIRPFGFKGRHATLVELADEAFQLHHGMQSASRIEVYGDQPLTHLGDGPSYDPDNDGVENESSAGQAVLMASYLSMLGTPTIRPPEDPELVLAWARGRRLFEAVGCNECHRSSLRFHGYDAEISALGSDSLHITIDLSEAGIDPIPRALDATPDQDGFIPGGVPIFAYTDLRRHDMGAALAEPRGEALPDGTDTIPGSVWQTRSLWGLADTAPYLHDGRAPTVHDAIVWHGGEGAAARQNYLDLPVADQGAIRVFLMSLTREGAMLVE